MLQPLHYKIWRCDLGRAEAFYRVRKSHFQASPCCALYFTTKEWILSRRDQMKVAWHEVPGNKVKEDPSRRDG